MKTAKLRLINDENFVAEAEYGARVECSIDREKAWVVALETFAARILQNMHRNWVFNRKLKDHK